MSARKVFIYNASGTEDLWVHDFNTLFTTSEKIFPARPDIKMCDFNFDMSDLKDPVFVVPGGSTLQIGKHLKSQIEKIKSHYGNNFSYVGVCAGAFLGASDAELFATTHNLGSKITEFESAISIGSTKKENLAFNIIENYQAFGSFYPDYRYLGAYPQQIMPYCVSIALKQCKQPLPQLYLQGPALYPMQEAKFSTEESVATFVGSENYKKYNSHMKFKILKPLSAIVRKLPAEKSGGKLLSCVHIEACVPDSKILKFFQHPSDVSPGIDKNEHELLVNKQKETQEQVETLLRETLKLTPR